MKIVSLKTDFAFKEFMSNEVVLRYFLAATLDVDVDLIRSVRLLNPFLGRFFRRQKQGILDVLVEFNDDTKINIEMQVTKQKYWKQRNLFYLGKMYVDDLRFGEHYIRLRKCIGISLLDFNLDEDDSGHHIYRMRDEYGRDFSDMWELHIIELKKVFEPEDALADWVQLFNAKTEEELDMIKSTNIGIRAGIKMVKDMSLTGWIRAEMEAREKARRDRFAQDEYIRDEGRREGRQEGVEEFYYVVKALKSGRSEESLIAEGFTQNMIDKAKDLI